MVDVVLVDVAVGTNFIFGCGVLRGGRGDAVARCKLRVVLAVLGAGDAICCWWAAAAAAALVDLYCVDGVSPTKPDLNGIDVPFFPNSGLFLIFL